MMIKIKELDDKYLVLKWRDITEGLNEESTKVFADLVQKVDAYRRLVRERPVQKYVVLNLEDEINLYLLRMAADNQQSFLPVTSCKVEKIAVDLINAILATKVEESNHRADD